MDFWNNPLLVTAVRSRFRGGIWLHVLGMYPVVLLMIGAAVPILYPQKIVDWPHYGFLALMILQFAGSGLVATASASHSLKSEVVNQTLDFLRLTPLTPWQILIGKMLGETSLAFFAAVASFPVGVVCWAVGGTDLVTLILLYVNLVIYVLLCGAAGLTMRLELREDKRVEYVSILALSGWMSAIPILSTMSLELPYRFTLLIASPLVMIVMTFFILHVMARTLESPYNPPASKAVAYAMLLAVDVVAAVLITLVLPAGPGARIVAFWSIHLAATAQVISGVTPWRESLRTWCWRHRGRIPPWRDAFLGDRSANEFAVLTAVVTGLAVFAGFSLPICFVEGDYLDAMWGTALLSSALALAYGALFQWNSLIFGRSGNGLIVLFVACLVVPYYLGLVDDDFGWIAQFSPFAHYARWFLEKQARLPRFAGLVGDTPMLIIVVALLLGLALLAHGSFAARMRYLGRVVDRKLEKMGVTAK